MSELTKAICQVMAAVRYVPETGKNAFHGYAYASDEDLLTVLQPAMASAGLAMVPTRIDSQTVEHAQDRKGKPQYRTDLLVTYVLLHSSGESIAVMAPGCGLDGEDKGVYKAMTGALKYALRHTFLVPTGQDAERAADSEPEQPKAKPTQKPTAKAPEPKKEPTTSANDESTLHDVCDQLVASGWKRETLRADVLDFACWLGVTADVWATSPEKLANMPAWLLGALNKPFRDRWSIWWVSIDQILAKNQLTRADLVKLTVAMQKPEPSKLHEEERNKLLVYLRSAGGLERLLELARRAA
jgi:hypothetical protein